jgi:hypothetical protein
VSEKQRVQVRKRRSREEVEQLTIEFEASGLRLMEFCRKHGLPPSTLQRQLKRRRLGSVQAKQDNRLVAVTMPKTDGDKDPRDACALLVVLSCGWRIEVWPDFDSITLERLIGALERTKARK